MQNQVAVVILNYKVKDKVLRCLKSVENSSYKNLKVVVVDNNSGDNLEDALKQKNVTFIQTGDNLGYSGGNNVGIKNALAGGADFVFVLNPDAFVKKDTIEALVKGFSSEDIGITGPKIYFADSKKIWYAGGQLDLSNVLGSHRGVDQIDRGQFDQISETDYMTGAAMMVRKEVFETIGLFDDRYFLYYEDSDLSFRAKRAGFKILYIPKAVVYHENAQSTGLGSPLQDYFITRNRMLFASKFLKLKTQLALLKEAVRNLKYPARRLALFDFLTGNLGKGSFIK